MVIWENANVQVNIIDGEYSIYYKIVKINYSKETLKQIMNDIRFEIHLEGGSFLR